MSQPPDQPPQQGGFGVPQPPQPPQPGYGPPQPGYGPPQQPAPPGAPGPYGQPPQPPAPGQAPQQPAPHGQVPEQSGPYGQPPQPPAPHGQVPQQSGPYGQPPQPPAPGQAPQQPGPYGQPQQQPGPYGQPSQPGPYGPQPGYGYGYPPQPQYPGAPGTPPPGGSGNRFKGKPAMITAAVVAALLVVGVGVYVATGDGDGKKKPVAEESDHAEPTGSAAPADDDGSDTENLNEGRGPGDAKVLWSKTAPDAPGSGADAPGMWITDSTAVKAAYKQVFAYRVADGTPAWAPVTFPEKICAVTPQKSADNKVVVAYMSGTSDRAECNRLQQLDLDTGVKGWSGTVADGALFDSTTSVQLTIAGRTLMVGRSQSGTAYDLAGGKKLYDKKKYGKCFPNGFAGGTNRLISVASCDALGGNEHDEIQELDPATGRVRWTQPVKKGWTVARTYSVDPLVVYMTNDDKKAWNISTFTSAGKFRSEVGFDEDFAPQCDWSFLARDLQGCQGVATDADTLYLPTDSSSGANEIVAISLANGKAKWRVKSPADEEMAPIRVEGGKLIAYVQPSYDAAGQVVSIPTAGATHPTTKLLQNPKGAAEAEGDFYDGAVDWVGGRLYISATRLNGKDDKKEKLMLAFGK
ncbi:PQQ-binding-like beta-propeller repeat protein [Streptomyces sp. NPDC086787]|uniref:outer membrane protein assembly factor BamB family protein n=1 Tax=Streptomyces sp. NPDC086787 TaxID=3365759 RepID=UPI0038133424